MASYDEATAAWTQVKLGWDMVWNALNKNKAKLSSTLQVEARTFEIKINNYIGKAFGEIAEARAIEGTVTGMVVAPMRYGKVVESAAVAKTEVQAFHKRLLDVGIPDADFVAPPELNVWPLVKLGLLVGTGYLLYRWGKDIFSEDYPRHKLPRYAGGSR